MELWLNVAEKPSVAKEIANVFSNRTCRSSRSHSQYNPLFEFPFSLQSGQRVNMVVTSVVGHLLSTDFTGEDRRWSPNVQALFGAPIHTYVDDNLKGIVKNLEEQGRRAHTVVLWLDCDREGENICFEVLSVVQRSNPRIRVKRAHFSSLTARDLLRAVNNLGVPNKALSDAVDARKEMDLRIGAAFTRFQTMKIRDNIPNAGTNVISFGPCQFPTLGFVVRNHWEREGFISENFYHATLEWSGTVFRWSRGNLYDLLAATVVFEDMMAKALEKNSIATVVGVDNRPTRRRGPAPLATVEMQRAASSILRLPSERTMALAEKLYQEGYISYPRTETDSFSLSDAELQELARTVAADSPLYGPYCGRVLSGELYQRPRNGGHDDKAHPPIHPTKPYNGPPGDPSTRLYDLIVRTFLACMSKDAIAAATTVSVLYGDERFTAGGQTILERNWLDIYPFERWNSTRIPNMKLGDTFKPTSVLLNEGQTQPPQQLTEAQLITLMDQQGIGTDATIATHIKTIQDRGYVVFSNGKFAPSPLGTALVAAYEELGLQQLAQPRLRAQMEAAMNDIARGNATKQQVVDAASAQYKAILGQIMSQQDKVLSCVARYLAAAQNQNQNPQQQQAGGGF